ncbi:glycosyltransferase family 2 protein [Candidatus Dojkabacteria bacterium]|nr:glycosyltransferase family 2 protein [Candidatus Dojkabacteria bacterium]
MKTKVSIILPTRNEEQLIKGCLTDISKYLKSKNYLYEIIVVINGCSDKTVDIVKDQITKDNRIKIVESKPGYGLALKKGMQSAEGDYVVIFNVDFYDLRMIDLVDIDLYGRDLVMGSKMAHWSEDNRSIQRRIFSFAYNLLLKIIFGFKGSDTHGIKVMNRNVVDKVMKKCKTTSGIMDTEFVIRAQRENFKIADFPVIVEEKRGPRFDNRLFSTPIDIINLYKALNTN